MSDSRRIDDVIDHITDLLETDGVVTPTRQAERSLRSELRRMYDAGRNDILTELMPANTVAGMLELRGNSYLHRLSRENGIGWTIGRERLYTPGDVQELRDIMADDKRRKGTS
ncbi:MAG TPA: hypothetical protein VNZ58_07425 [Thermomicrobiales bacterium]|nr:hypothetical protein [Thermomicrobiales bacterium]